MTSTTGDGLALSAPHEIGAARATTRRERAAAYAALTYAAVFVHALVFAADVRYLGAATVAFTAVVHVTYAAMYAAAGLAPAGAAFAILSLPGLRRIPGRARGAVVAGLAVLGPAAVHFALFADAFVHRRYGFHLNGMIWNLVTTPGGLESMDASRGTEVVTAGVAVACVAVQSLLLGFAGRWRSLGSRVATVPRRAVVTACAALVVASGAERVAYGLCHAAGYRPVATAGSAYPGYQRARLVGLAKSLGLASDGDEDGTIAVAADGAGLRYPLAPLRRAAGARDMNVLWLVAESLRADALCPEVMPSTVGFAAESVRFLDHRSGGNGTRMGMFSMFYGLHGPYWFPALAESRGPALLDALTDGGWDVAASTSAKFTFPEFDRTIFARVPRDRLREGDPALKGWQNDREHVTRLLEDLDARDPSKPFFRFQFFESPHARYLFPKESVIRPDYEKDLNYVTMDLADPSQVERIRNRYLNACHHLDQQLGRIWDHLRTRRLLDSTVVVLTGDHGEEFMEKGRWGHHSAFSEEQIRTPLVIRVPGEAPRVVRTPTSHEDIPGTVLRVLGWENPPSDHSFGTDLLRGPARTHSVVADWDRVAWVGADSKIVLSVQGMGGDGDAVTTIDDAPVADERAVRTAHRDDVAGVLRELSRFLR